jgi:hypothetical protein
LSDPLSGELLIGAYEGTAAGLPPEIVGRLEQTHPRITFNIVLADPRSKTAICAVAGSIG